MNNLVATVRPDYPGLQKPVLAAQPAVTAPPEAAVPVIEQPKAPEPNAPLPVRHSFTRPLLRRQSWR